MIKKFYFFIYLIFTGLVSSEKSLVVNTVAAPVIRSSNSTLTYEPRVFNGSDLSSAISVDFKSIVLSSCISKSIGLFNNKIQSPFVLLIAVEGASIALDCFQADSALSDMIATSLINEANRASSLLLAGAVSGAAVSVDQDFFSDKHVSIYRFVKDGIIISICIIYPLVFDSSLTLSSMLSSIALNRLYNFYQDSKNHVKEKYKEDVKKSSAKKGWIVGISTSVAGAITASCAVRYCTDIWSQIKNSTAFEAGYVSGAKLLTTITDSIFSFHNLH